MDRRPQPPGVGSIFANALATARPTLSQDPGSHTRTLTCRSCGAPRQRERADMRCTYCGGSLFGRYF